MELTFLAPDEQDKRPKKITRTSKPKTRTGCITCKIRRVKCDEGKPNCSRCTSTGRTCDGYALLETAASRSTKSSSITKVLALAPAPVIQQFPGYYQGSLSEQRSLDFFFKRTAPQLSGFFDGAFWTRLVPQLSTSEPAIRHALIAVGSFHEKTEQIGIPWGVLDVPATAEVIAYDKAVSALITRLDRDQGSTRILLTACLLFICMEFLQGDLDAAMTHIESGIKVFLSAREKKRLVSTIQSSWDFDLAEAELAPMFCALSAVATLFGRPSLELYSRVGDGAGSSIPAKYSSMSEAKLDFFDLCNTCLRFIDSVGEARYNFTVDMDQIIEKVRLTSRLEEWKAAFDAFAEFEELTWTSVEVGASDVLRAGFLTMKVRLAGSLEPYELAWDEYRSEFEEIVRWCEKVLQSATESTNKPNRYFSFEHGIVGPLHVVAWRCRWPLIRRKALSLLYLHPRREALYDSRRSYNIMKRVMLVEELSLGIPPGQEPAWDQLPPEYARIYQVDITTEPATSIGTPVHLISKPDGIFGDWHIRREFIHLGSIKIHGSMPMHQPNHPGFDLMAMEQSLSQSSGTSGSSFGVQMPLLLKAPDATVSVAEIESGQYHRRKRLLASGGPVVEGEAHEISPLGAFISDPVAGN